MKGDYDFSTAFGCIYILIAVIAGAVCGVIIF